MSRRNMIWKSLVHIAILMLLPIPFGPSWPSAWTSPGSSLSLVEQECCRSSFPSRHRGNYYKYGDVTRNVIGPQDGKILSCIVLFHLPLHVINFHVAVTLKFVIIILVALLHWPLQSKYLVLESNKQPVSLIGCKYFRPLYWFASPPTLTPMSRHLESLARPRSCLLTTPKLQATALFEHITQ